MSDYLDDRVSGDDYRALLSERDKLQAKITRMEGQTNYCLNCEGYAGEIDRLKAELDLIKQNMKKNWPECALMDEVIADRDAWKLKAEKLANCLKDIAVLENDAYQPIGTIMEAVKIAKEALAEFDF